MRVLAFALLVGAALPLAAQSSTSVSGGEVSRAPRMDTRRLSTRVPQPDPQHQGRVRISGDSAQRLAMHDFEWRGRVLSVELDEGDERMYWDVKIVPDSAPRTVLRYRVDAASAGILGIREFTDLGGIKIRKP